MSNLRRYATLTDAIEWARQADAGEYLAEYDDDDLDEMTDEGSRCGWDDAQLAEIDKVLERRGLILRADDRGLVAAEVQS